jgi:hypothetical protein
MGFSPPLRQIFLIQCLNNGLALFLSTLILGCGFSLFDDSVAHIVENAGVGFWVGLLGLFAFMGLLVRVATLMGALRLWGTFFRGELFGIQTHSQNNAWQEALRLMVESLQLACPALWALDLLGRQLDFPLGLRYAYTDESNPRLD